MNKSTLELKGSSVEDVATLKIGDAEETLAIVTGTEAERAIDISKLRGDTGLITLDEGPQMMSNVVGCPPEQVKIGMSVEVTFEDWTEDISVAMFKLVE